LTAEQQYPLDWIGEFINSVRPYIHLRRTDNLVILLPNKGYKLNPSGIDILEHLLDNKAVEELLARSLNPAKAQRDIYHFMCDFRALISGCFGDGRGRKAVERIKYEIPFTKLPVLSEIALTYRCNLACKFCYAACNCHSSKSEELETVEIKRLLKVIRDQADVPSVSFTGGEPTLRKDLPELIAYARKIGLRVNLISNGTKIDTTLAKELCSAGLNSVQISIEGPDASVHEGLTAVPGSFERTLAGIRAMRDQGIHTQTNTTINARNADHVEGIVELLSSLKLPRFAMNMLTPSGAYQANEDLFISYTEIGEVVSRVQKRAKKLNIEFLWYSPTPYCLFNPLTEGLGNKSCAACDGLLSIDPLGNILPCSSFDQGVGNLLQDQFEDIWHSAQAEFWRHKKYAPQECDNCDSFTACAAACPLYWQAKGTDELTQIQQIEVAL
jgi:radical SAM protein with 4Fe4S-binding SPASM domain